MTTTETCRLPGYPTDTAGAYSTVHNDAARVAERSAVAEPFEHPDASGPLYRLRFLDTAKLTGTAADLISDPDAFVLNCYGTPATFGSARGAVGFAAVNGLLPRATRREHVARPSGYPGPYTIMHANVDGAGFIREGGPKSDPIRYGLLADAEAVAEALQRRALADGNPWGYTHSIRAEGWRGEKLITFS